MNVDGYIYLQQVRAIALALPGVTEGPCHGTPGFRVHRKLLARIKEDGETLAIRTQERDKWLQAAPDIFFLTDHYLNYPMMLVHLSKVNQQDLAALFLAAWKERAPKKLVQTYETAEGMLKQGHRRKGG
ncbi:MAG TPA: MmcQ/YjbR family DNA-binding protein [Chitinophaga sp.]|uniref:MmcQ/YjbR family DNA-binding protein n=1 Tax=Chitinophaga sp. TaxID=1869181 RepID=UPI002DBB436B|nr:MmcQ/YjbR family DNA-binding protein [Chitinophaga sp.]HEU4552406.1 MmcQ/YjbR family DNA-binding protein [Chitinophaga sp.]